MVNHMSACKTHPGGVKTDFYWISSGLQLLPLRRLPNFTGFYWILLDFTEF